MAFTLEPSRPGIHPISLRNQYWRSVVAQAGLPEEAALHGCGAHFTAKEAFIIAAFAPQLGNENETARFIRFCRESNGFTVS